MRIGVELDVDLYDEALLGLVRPSTPVVEDADLDLSLLGPPSPFRDTDQEK